MTKSTLTYDQLLQRYNALQDAFEKLNEKHNSLITTCWDLDAQIGCLQQEVRRKAENAEADRLREELERSRQRERAAILARDEALEHLRVKNIRAWDSVLPSKEACKRILYDLGPHIIEDLREAGESRRRGETEMLL